MYTKYNSRRVDKYSLYSHYSKYSTFEKLNPKGFNP